jgi:hypothetical protein
VFLAAASRLLARAHWRFFRHRNALAVASTLDREAVDVRVSRRSSADAPETRDPVLRLARENPR